MYYLLNLIFAVRNLLISSDSIFHHSLLNNQLHKKSMSRRAMSNRRLLIPTNRKHLLKLPPPCNVCWWLVLINRWFTFQGSRTHEVPSGAALQRHHDLIHTLRAELMLIIKLYLPFVYLDTSSRKIASSSNITNVKQPILSQIFIINSHTSMLRT